MKTYIQQDTQLEKILFFTSLATALFTLGIFINHTFFQSEHVLIGVLQELLTLPAILAQPIIIAMSLRLFIRNNYNLKSLAFTSLTLATIVLSSVCLGFGVCDGVGKKQSDYPTNLSKKATYSNTVCRYTTVKQINYLTS